MYLMISLLTVPSVEIHKAFPGVVSRTQAFVYVSQLLFDSGTEDLSLLSHHRHFSLVVVFGEGKRINSFPRGLGYSVSSPHTHTWEAIFPPSVGSSREMDLKESIW